MVPAREVPRAAPEGPFPAHGSAPASLPGLCCVCCCSISSGLRCVCVPRRVLVLCPCHCPAQMESVVSFPRPSPSGPLSGGSLGSAGSVPTPSLAPGWWWGGIPGGNSWLGMGREWDTASALCWHFVTAEHPLGRCHCSAGMADPQGMLILWDYQSLGASGLCWNQFPRAGLKEGHGMSHPAPQQLPGG